MWLLQQCVPPSPALPLTKAFLGGMADCAACLMHLGWAGNVKCGCKKRESIFEPNRNMLRNLLGFSLLFCSQKLQKYFCLQPPPLPKKALISILCKAEKSSKVPSEVFAAFVAPFTIFKELCSRDYAAGTIEAQ